MCIRSLPVEIEMMPIQQESRKNDLEYGLKECKGFERTVPNRDKKKRLRTLQ